MVDRLRVQWEEIINRNVRNLLDVRKWRTMVRRRNEWKTRNEEAMVRTRVEEL